MQCKIKSIALIFGSGRTLPSIIFSIVEPFVVDVYKVGELVNFELACFVLNQKRLQSRVVDFRKTGSIWSHCPKVSTLLTPV